jgi:DNA-binding transcriptional ArsR family regulator
MDKLLIDKDTLKALVVDTRLNILKLLHKRKYTLSELSKILNLSASTIKEHLDILCKVDLAKKEDNNRKWKYYSLTYKGLNLINPSETKALFSFVLSLIITIGVGLFFLSSTMVASSNTFESPRSSLNIENLNNYDSVMISSKTMRNDSEVLNQEVPIVAAKEVAKSDFKLNVNFSLGVISSSLFITFVIISICLLINYSSKKNKIKYNV